MHACSVDSEIVVRLSSSMVQNIENLQQTVDALRWSTDKNAIVIINFGPRHYVTVILSDISAVKSIDTVHPSFWSWINCCRGSSTFNHINYRLMLLIVVFWSIIFFTFLVYFRFGHIAFVLFRSRNGFYTNWFTYRLCSRTVSTVHWPKRKQ